MGAIQQLAGEDKQWQPEEFLSLGKYLQSFMAKDEGYTLAKDAKRYVNGVEVASNPGPEGSDASRQRDDEIRDAEEIFTKDGHPRSA